ncbi:proline-rich receptor-like protein kinase PERK8 [Columba livia]|uniref:Proline-rich receptor-like protein kinase PERK8 n=1 Tax=Columba livia TaxID=8932 RepID=A0A2I0M873_COLLI|nr:proline-rich receptor-like protein kinase PERK8 [Columba livia]
MLPQMVISVLIRAMVLGQAVLVLLALSSLWVCGAEPPPGPPQGLQWVWGVARQERAEPPRLSRSRRDDGGQQPDTTTPGHEPPATAMPKNIETDSLEPDLLLGSVPPPSTNASLHQAPAVTTTTDPLDETDSPEPDLLLRSAPAPSTNASLHWAHVVPSTADPLDETDSPEPDLMLSSAPAPSTHTSLYRALMVPTTSDPQDETDSPDPDLLPGSKAKAPSGPTHSAPWDMEPWEPNRVVGKCLLAILLLGLMVCISSLLPDGEAAANGPRPGPARRPKLLLDGDGDNLTLSSFLPEHT